MQDLGDLALPMCITLRGTKCEVESNQNQLHIRRPLILIPNDICENIDSKNMNVFPSNLNLFVGEQPW